MKILLAIILVMLAAPAMAWTRGVGTLYNGASVLGLDDGFNGAPKAMLDPATTYHNANMLTSNTPGNGGLFQNFQTIEAHLHDASCTASSTGCINWNVAGLDYPVGIPACIGTFNGGVACGFNGAYCNGGTLPCSSGSTAQTKLINPKTYNWATDPAGTGCGTGSGYASNVVTCVPNAATVNLTGFDFSPAGTCVGLTIADTGAVTGGTALAYDTINVKASRIVMSGDASCVALAGNMVLYNVNPAHYWKFNFWSNFFDGAMQNATAGKYTGITPVVNIQEVNFGTVTSNTAVSVRYNVFQNMSARGIQFGNMACGGDDLSYNVIHNFGMYNEAVHGEFTYYNPIHDGFGNQNVQCPGFVGPTWNVTFPSVAITSWASLPQSATTTAGQSGAYGTWQSHHHINNVLIQDSNISGGTSNTDIFNEAFGWGDPSLVDTLDGIYALNLYGYNSRWDAGLSYTAASSWAAAAATIALSGGVCPPSAALNQYNGSWRTSHVEDTTTGKEIGAALSCSGGTVTLDTGGALNAGSAGDAIQINPQPYNLGQNTFYTTAVSGSCSGTECPLVTTGGVGTGYNSVATAEDLLTPTNATLPNCAPQAAGGPTPSSYQPTLVIHAISPNFDVRVADSGNCGYSQPSWPAGVHLACVSCASGSFPPGTDTGWTFTPASSYLGYAGVAVALFGVGSTLNGAFTNFEKLAIQSNLMVTSTSDGTKAGIGVFNANYSNEGRLLNCTGAGVAGILPTSATYPFVPSLSAAHNATVVTSGTGVNFTGSGASITTFGGGSPLFASQNGC